MLEVKAEAEQQPGFVNTIDKDKEKDSESMTTEENRGLNIQTRTERNNQRTDRGEQRQALAFLAQESQPRRSGSNRS